MPEQQQQMIRESLRAELVRTLTTAGIDTAGWGTGASKSPDDLLREIEQGEAELTAGSDGSMLRRIWVANVDVAHTDATGERWQLCETGQIFADGRPRERADIPSAVKEKLHRGEEPLAAAERGVREELGIGGELALVLLGTERKWSLSQSYPGLTNEVVVHAYRLELSSSQFRPEGYVERQSDKVTSFVWRPDPPRAQT